MDRPEVFNTDELCSSQVAKLMSGEEMQERWKARKNMDS